MSDFCPICHAPLMENSFCSTCGFDPSADAETYATLGTVELSGYRTLWKRRLERTEAQMAPLRQELFRLRGELAALRGHPGTIYHHPAPAPSPVQPVKPSQEPSVIPANRDPIGPEPPSVSRLVHTLRKAKSNSTRVLGNKKLLKTAVKSVFFQSTLSGVSDSSWDVSEEGDGSILAWMTGDALHIGSEGVVRLNPDSSFLFEKYENLERVEFGSCVDTSKVTKMVLMFSGCYSLTALDLSRFDTSRVTNMYGMFYDCHSLRSLDVSGFDTSKVTEMCWMFDGCSSLSTLDLSRFDVSRVTDMRWMFRSCSSLTHLDLSRFSVPLLANITEMFSGCPVKDVITTDKRIRRALKVTR